MASSGNSFPTLGIIGGGQLGKMFIQKASQWSVPVIILDPDPDCPASVLANQHLPGNLTDAEAIQRLSDISDVLSWEIEHIGVDKLIELKEQGKTIIPDPHILKTIQDKGLQKEFYARHAIATAPFFVAKNKSEAQEKLRNFGFPKVAVKSRTGGYDGKGVFIADTEAILADANHIPFDGPLMIEAFIPCKAEIAVLVARNRAGDMAVYPPIEMEFDPQSNLVAFLVSPAGLPEYLDEKAKQLALDCAAAFDSPGLLAVEMFLSEDNELYVNEVAPRPHNSAHHTIEGFYTSQYEQLLRILLDLPLGPTAMKMPCAMVNIVGNAGVNGPYRLKYLDTLVKMPGVYVHLYGKKESRPNRKLGHVTVMANTREAVLEIAQKVRTLLEIEPHP